MADSLGIWLRRAREARRVDLSDVERALRIRRRYLQALETGDYEALPGAIQARGFLRNYARFLGLPVEDALARYDAELRGQLVQPRLPEIVVPSGKGERTWAPPPPTAEEERVAVRANSTSGLLQILVVAIIFFVLVGLGSFIWLQFTGRGSAVASSPTPTTSAAGSVAETVTPTAEATLIFPVATDGTVDLRLVTTNHAWVSLSADEAVIFQGIAEPQQVLEANAEEIVIVATGNGGAFHLYLNGTDFGMLGEQGEVVRRAWTPQGETPLGETQP